MAFQYTDDLAMEAAAVVNSLNTIFANSTCFSSSPNLLVCIAPSQNAPATHQSSQRFPYSQSGYTQYGNSTQTMHVTQHAPSSVQ